MPVSSGHHEDKLIVRVDGRLMATPLMVVLVCVEVTDVIFAVDSIPAIFAVTLDPFIIYTSNVFAIMGLRSLYFVLGGMMGMFHYLKLGLGGVLSFIGVKMLLGHTAWKIDTLVALGVVAAHPRHIRRRLDRACPPSPRATRGISRKSEPPLRPRMNTTETSPIVCGTDFSENADKAAVVADALARRLDAPCILAHSVDERGEFPENLRSRLMNDDRPRLEEQAARLRGLGLSFEEKLLRGVPDESVAQFAAQSTARLVVVGASVMGSSWMGRLLLGNISARIAESSRVPTLVVHDGAPFVAWARGERTLKVFVGVDFSTSSDAALRWIAELRQIGPCEVIAGYVDWPPEEAARLGVSGPVGLDDNPPEIQQMIERDVREKIAHLLGGENVRVCVRGNAGRADAPLLDMAAEAQADLVVIGTHQWHGLSRLRHGSVSRAILRHAPMSVACVPAPAAAPVSGPRVRECPRVLVAVDIHEPHGFASRYAYGITAPRGTVRLMHNLEPVAPTDTVPKDPATAAAEAEAKLRALTPHEAEARGIATEVEITESRETAKAICAAAERFGADIICIGSHTRPGFTAKVLGSVALAVLQTSRRAVLVVWPPVV